MAFPTSLTGAVNRVTKIIAEHLNALEAKIGVDGSAVATTLDYLVKNVLSVNPGHKHSKLFASGGNPEVVTVVTGNVTVDANLYIASGSGTGGFARFGSTGDGCVEVTPGDGTGAAAPKIELFTRDTATPASRGKITGDAFSGLSFDTFLTYEFTSGDLLVLSGNVGVGTSTFGTNATKTLGIKTGVVPASAPADIVQVYSIDKEAGKCVLGVYQEYAPYAGVGVASSHKIPVNVNGTMYYILATTVE